MTPCQAVGHRTAVSTPFRTIIGPAWFQSSDLVQTPSRGTCPGLGAAAPATAAGKQAC